MCGQDSGWPAVPVYQGLREFPGLGIFNAKPEKVLGKPRWTGHPRHHWSYPLTAERYALERGFITNQCGRKINVETIHLCGRNMQITKSLQTVVHENSTWPFPKPLRHRDKVTHICGVALQGAEKNALKPLYPHRRCSQWIQECLSINLSNVGRT